MLFRSRETGVIIERMAAISAEIAGAVDQQTDAVRAIARSAVQASEATDVVAGSIREVLAAAHDTETAAETVLANAGRLGEESGRLESEVSRFLHEVEAA